MFRDLKSLILMGVIAFLAILLIKQGCENRGLKDAIADELDKMAGKFEQLEGGVAKAEQMESMGKSLAVLLEDLPESIGKRIKVSNEDLRKIAKFIAESDTARGGGEVTRVDSNLAIFEDKVQTISCYGNPVSVDRLDYVLKPFLYEGGYVMTDKEDYFWLKNLTLDQEIHITDYKVYDKRSFWQKWRYAIGVYGDADWKGEKVKGDLGVKIALGYNRWLIDIKKPVMSVDEEAASFDLSNTQTWKFGVNRDFWWK